MLAHSLNVDSECLVLPDLVSLFGSLGDGDEQVLNFLIVNFHHGDLHLILFVGVGVLGDPREYFFAGDGNNALGEMRVTLLAPYPTIEYDFPAPVCP